VKYKTDPYEGLSEEQRAWAIRRTAEIAKETKPLLSELASVGFMAGCLDDLREGPIKDRRVLEVLLRHLQMPYSTPVNSNLVRGTIADALIGAKTQDREFGTRMLALLSVDNYAQVQFKLALAIDNAVGPDELPALKRILEDQRRNPGVRAAVLSTYLKHSRTDDVDYLLSFLGDEPAVVIVAVKALARKKVPGIRSRIEEWAASVTLPEWKGPAKRALKLFGNDVKAKPRYLVSNRKKIPSRLAEWSMSLGLDEIRPPLESLSRLVQSGFGAAEVNEVVDVAEDMAHDDTRTFRFPVSVDGAECEVWISVFMDDEDLPDLAIFGPASLIGRLCYEPEE
jgi:hypothetical protein